MKAGELSTLDLRDWLVEQKTLALSKGGKYGAITYIHDRGWQFEKSFPTFKLAKEWFDFQPRRMSIRIYGHEGLKFAR